MDFMNSNLH